MRPSLRLRTNQRSQHKVNFRLWARPIDRLAVSGIVVPPALFGTPHARDYLFSRRRVGPSFLGRRRFLLAQNRIGVRRPQFGNHVFARRRIGPPSLGGLTHFCSAGRATERRSPFRPSNGIGPSRLRYGALSLTHFGSDDPWLRVSAGLSHSLRPAREEAGELSVDAIRQRSATTYPVTLAQMRGIDHSRHTIVCRERAKNMGAGRWRLCMQPASPTRPR